MPSIIAHLAPWIGGALALLALYLFIRAGVRAFIERRIVVPTNMVHIVQRGGSTTSYGKDQKGGNVYYAWPSHFPWIGVTVTELPVSVFTVELKDYEAYDSGRLPFKVDVRAFFRITDSDTAAHRVAHFTELESQLGFVLQGAVRRVLATNPLEGTMQDRAKLGQEFTDQVGPQLSEWGVENVKMIEFMDIRDHDGSNVIANIMAKEKSRIERESRVAVAANVQAAQQAEIAAKQEVGLRQAEADQTVGQRQAGAKQAVGIAEQQAQQEVLSQAKETTTREMEVKSVQDVRSAEIARNVAEVAALQAKNVAITNAEGEQRKIEIGAEASLNAAKKQADAIRANGEGQAASIQAQGLAKAEAEKALQMAPVAAQISLAKEIGENKGYQSYLVGVKQIEANRDVGIEQAKALSAAQIKVIATGASASGGLGSVGGLISPASGAMLGGALEAFSETPAGEAILGAATRSRSKNGASAS